MMVIKLALSAIASVLFTLCVLLFLQLLHGIDNEYYLILFMGAAYIVTSALAVVMIIEHIIKQSNKEGEKK